MLRLFQFVVAPSLLAGRGGGADADQVDRAMARVVIGVAEEIFRRELPVRRENPFVHADHLGAALAAVAAVQRLVEMDFGVAEIGEEFRRVLVPGRPDRALVDRKLRHRHQRVGVAVELAVIERAILRHALQLAVGGVGPAVIGAGEDRGVALFVAAHLHAAMPARIEEGVNHALLVAAQDDRLFAHPRRVEVAGIWNQAFVADEQPGAGENLVELFLVEIGVDEDFAADEALLGVDETSDIIETAFLAIGVLRPGAFFAGRCRQGSDFPDVRTVDIVLEFSSSGRLVSRGAVRRAIGRSQSDREQRCDLEFRFEVGARGAWRLGRGPRQDGRYAVLP